MTARARWLILLFALAGLAFAGSSAWVHYRLLTDPTYVSPCDISATFNCSLVYMSSYGAVAGVPVALGGVVWFVLVGLIAALASADAPGRSPAGAYIFALSTVGLASVLYLGYASFFVLKTGCLLCMGTYVAVVGIFIVSGLTSSTGVGSLPGRLSRDLRAITADPTLLLTGALFVAGAAGLVAFFPKEGSVPQAAAARPMEDDAAQAFRRAWDAQPRVDLGIAAEGASVVVVKFVDWQCPSCKAAYSAYQPVYEKFGRSHPGAVREVVKDYPLSNRCNYSMSSDPHPSACEQAAAVRLAAARGKAGEMVTWLFALPNQTMVTPDQVKKGVAELLGVTDFDQQYAALLPAIRQDTADGRALGVNSTPTYFVNGVRAQTEQGWLHPQLFELAITIELEKAGG